MDIGYWVLGIIFSSQGLCHGGQVGGRGAATAAEHLGTGEVRVYYVPKGHWDQVTYVVRDGDDGPISYTYGGGPQER